MLNIERKGHLLRFSGIFQYVMFDQFPQPLSLKNQSKREEKWAPFPVMNKRQLFDLNMKPSALTFNNVSSIKRELENLLWHMVAAVWNLFSLPNLKFQFHAKSLFCKWRASPRHLIFTKLGDFYPRNKKLSKFRRHLIMCKESGVWLYRDVISVVQR